MTEDDTHDHVVPGSDEAIDSADVRGYDFVGADYVVYTSIGMEGDGSLSGAPPNKAVSWGKIKDHDTNYTQIEAEATLVFPLIVAGAFKN